ncbi:MAG: hypothetical protein P1V20_04085 [Verrucomicrobiales bacterium]|nr:hypothetical protein [Verrucomicrobiales bacterium]
MKKQIQKTNPPESTLSGKIKKLIALYINTPQGCELFARKMADALKRKPALQR